MAENQKKNIGRHNFVHNSNRTQSNPIQSMDESNPWTSLVTSAKPFRLSTKTDSITTLYLSLSHATMAKQDKVMYLYDTFTVETIMIVLFVIILYFLEL